MSDLRGPNMSREWTLEIGTKLLGIIRAERSKSMEASITELCDYDQSGPCDICHERDAYNSLQVTPGWLEQHASTLREDGLGNLLLTERMPHASLPGHEPQITFSLCTRDREHILALGLVEKFYEADCT